MLKLPFNWSIRGAWCTRDRIGGSNYRTGGLRDALRTQRNTKTLDPWDSQVVTYAFYIERSYEQMGWAHEEWQVEFTVDFRPLRVQKHVFAYHGLKRQWLNDTEVTWPDND